MRRRRRRLRHKPTDEAAGPFAVAGLATAPAAPRAPTSACWPAAAGHLLGWSTAVRSNSSCSCPARCERRRALLHLVLPFKNTEGVRGEVTRRAGRVGGRAARCCRARLSAGSGIFVRGMSSVPGDVQSRKRNKKAGGKKEQGSNMRATTYREALSNTTENAPRKPARKAIVSHPIHSPQEPKEAAAQKGPKRETLAHARTHAQGPA